MSMRELKTLKDLPNLYEGVGSAYYGCDLKAEAVKWIKEINKIIFRETLKTKDKQVVINTQNQKSIVNWIMGFFNLTEEDLK